MALTSADQALWLSWPPPQAPAACWYWENHPVRGLCLPINLFTIFPSSITGLAGSTEQLVQKWHWASKHISSAAVCCSFIVAHTCRPLPVWLPPLSPSIPTPNHSRAFNAPLCLPRSCFWCSQVGPFHADFKTGKSARWRVEQSRSARANFLRLLWRLAEAHWNVCCVLRNLPNDSARLGDS